MPRSTLPVAATGIQGPAYDIHQNVMGLQHSFQVVIYGLTNLSLPLRFHRVISLQIAEKT
jgi:hypothetical protein